MTFTDLPRNWTDLPLTDPTLAADVVDLYVTEGDRRSGVFSAILCDREARFIASIHLDLPDYADSPPTDTCEEVLDPVIPALQLRPDGALLLAIGRPGPATALPIDLEWSQAAAHLCRLADIRLLGFYVAVPGHVYLTQLTAPARELAHATSTEVDLTPGPMGF
ncbi:hypothetical protein [Kribbella sancticallisti]